MNFANYLDVAARDAPEHEVAVVLRQGSDVGAPDLDGGL